MTRSSALIFGNSPNVVALGGMIVLGPYVSKLGPPALRRWLVNLLPSSKIQTLKSIVDLLDQRSREIIAEKRIAIQQGGEALLQQVGEGHDAMSVLRKCAVLFIGFLVYNRVP